MASLKGTAHQVIEYDVGPLLEKRLHELNGNSMPGNTVHIFSHGGYVISRAEKLQSPGWTIRAASFKALPHSENSGLANGTSGKMSVEEAVELTKKILLEGGHVSEDTALLESYLRPRLFKRDRRAAKRFGDPSSVSLIRDVVQHGVRNRWLGRSLKLGSAGSEQIWLAEAASSAATQTLQNESPAPIVVLQPVTTGGSTLENGSPATLVNKGKVRTQEMVSVLNGAFLYSPYNIRRYAFAAIKTIQKEGAPVNRTVAQFMKAVKDRAVAQAETDGVVYKHWKPTMDAILEMLLGAKALIGPSEKTITRGLHARGTQLTSVIPNFEDACELFLLKVLINKMQLTNKDRISIAHALFKEGAHKAYDALEERLDALFTLLGSEISESEDGRIILENELSTATTTSSQIQ